MKNQAFLLFISDKKIYFLKVIVLKDKKRSVLFMLVFLHKKASILSTFFAIMIKNRRENLMLNKENKALHALLEAESDARQIRTHKNKVTAQNEKGAALFTSAADPFVFLQGTPQPERLEKLQHAYLNHYPVSVQLETPHAIWEVTLKNLPKATLLTARNISDTFQFQTWVQSEQRVLQESLDTLPVGFYITDTDGRIQYTNERLCGWLSRTKEELLHQSLNQLIKNELPVDENWIAEVFLKRPKSKPLSSFIFQNNIPFFIKYLSKIQIQL